MNYPKEYFQSEIIDGFEVSAMMKRCWAAQMEVLEIFDDICRRHSIRYFLADGTLLGAVRHKGFIPWDDDIDIWMFGDDLDTFIRDAGEEILSAGLSVLSPFTNKECTALNMAYRINNSKYTYNLREDFLKKYWLFPFVAGLDIFTLNYIPRDAACENSLMQLFSTTVAIGTLWNDMSISEADKMDMYIQLTKTLGVTPVEKEKIFNHIWKLSDRIGHMYEESESDKVAELSAYINNPSKIYKKEWFYETVYLEFAGKKFPCPACYKEVLISDFGEDYMQPQMIAGEHEYPYYKKQHKEMLDAFAKAGINCPEIYKGV